MTNQGPAYLGFPQATPPLDEPWYFPVSVPKLFVMSIASFGLYQVYWHYRNWRRYRARSTHRFSVLLRTLLGPLFSFRLFERMHHDLREAGRPGLPEPGVLALVYLGLNALLGLPDPWWVLAFLNVVPLMVAQAGVNRLHAAVAPGAPRNDSYSGMNVALIVLGTLLFLAMLVGLVVQTQQPEIREGVPVRSVTVGSADPAT